LIAFPTPEKRSMSVSELGRAIYNEFLLGSSADGQDDAPQGARRHGHFSGRGRIPRRLRRG